MKNIWQEIVNITEKSDRNINILNCNNTNVNEECERLGIPSDSVLF